MVNDNILFHMSGLFPSNYFMEDANHYIGNVDIIISGGVSLFMSDTIPSLFNGNLTISRYAYTPFTIPGPSTMFRAGPTIQGNFSFTNDYTGDTYFGNTNSKTTIGGTINISTIIPVYPHILPLPYVFSMSGLINQTTGGSISVQNSLGFNIQKDTLLVTSMSLTKYRGNANGYLLNNNITGDVTTTDDTSYSGGWGTFVRNNIITGNSSFSNNGRNIFYDADSAGTSNKYIGSITYIQTGESINVATGDFDEISQNLNLNSSAGITLGKIKFIGDSNGTIEQLGTQLLSISELIMEKTGGGTIELNNPVSIINTATFNSGNIISSSLNNLIFLNNAEQTGASSASFVSGPVTKIGNEAFIFPSGINNVYAPIGITAPVLATDAFRAQYFNINPNDAGYDSAKHDLTITHISQKEYWLLDRINGTAAPKITLSWNTNRSGSVDAINDLRVAQWNGVIWKDEGNGGVTGNADEGTIQSLNSISNFGPFTLASGFSATFFIWPNPAQDILYVYTQFANGNMTITDVRGRTILVATINNYVMTIPVGQLAHGLYILRILHDNDVFTSKFIKL